MRCIDASAELTTNRPPLALKTKGMLVSGRALAADGADNRIHRPAHGGAARPTAVRHRALAAYARTELHGLPIAPESATIRMDQPVVDRAEGDNVFKAERADLNARLVSGTVQENPVIETVVKLVGRRPRPGTRPRGADRCRHHRGGPGARGTSRRSPGSSGCASFRPPAAGSRS